MPPPGLVCGAALLGLAVPVGRSGWGDLFGGAREVDGCCCVGRHVVVGHVDALVVAPLAAMLICRAPGSAAWAVQQALEMTGREDPRLTGLADGLSVNDTFVPRVA